MKNTVLGFLSLIFISPAFGIFTDASVYMMPRNCQELLPDSSPFLNFFASVGRGLVSKDKTLAKHVFRILALHDELMEKNPIARENNPITPLIRKTLCFHRANVGANAIIPYDDPKLIAFLKTGLNDLDAKIDDAIFQIEWERAQKEYYEKQIDANEEVINQLDRQARSLAVKKIDEIAQNAKRKVQKVSQ